MRLNNSLAKSQIIRNSFAKIAVLLQLCKRKCGNFSSVLETHVECLYQTVLLQFGLQLVGGVFGKHVDLGCLKGEEVTDDIG